MFSFRRGAPPADCLLSRPVERPTRVATCRRSAYGMRTLGLTAWGGEQTSARSCRTRFRFPEKLPTCARDP